MKMIGDCAVVQQPHLNVKVCNLHCFFSWWV